MRVALEGGVIVVSILLAFALDAWWNERVEQGRVDEMLEAVASEFESEVVAMDSVAAENEHAVAWFGTTLQRTRPDLPPFPEDSIEIVGNEIIDFQIWEAGFGALAALLNGALLEKVADPELRRLLGGWEGELEDLQYTQQQVYDAIQRVADLHVSTERAPQFLDDENFYVTRLRAMATDGELRAAEVIVMDALNAYNADLYRVRERASEIVARIRPPSGSGR